jgi:hypothetical protein
MGSCPKCKRLWKRDAETSDDQGVSPSVGAPGRARMVEGGENAPDAPGTQDSDSPSRQARYYHRKRQDPEWLKREAARKRRERQR